MYLPANALEAVTHADPYPFYRDLRLGPPLLWDAALKMWLAAGVAAVEAALAHPGLRVRPPHEPVPTALRGSAAGKLFGLLVRMNDGAFHAEHKPQVSALAGSLRLNELADLAARLAADLQQRASANELLVRLPVQVMAAALGVPSERLDRMADEVLAFTRGVAAGATPAQVAQAGEAAAALMAFWQGLGHGPAQAAHRIGLMMQSLDATAGLLGNTVLCLQRRPEAGAQLALSHTAACDVVAEVARWDAPVQNTRRFAASALTLMGQPLEAGQAVLLVLASANRDEALNPRGDDFAMHRRERRSVGFGAGAHACPAEKIAIEIVAASARVLWAGGQFDSYFRAAGGYLPLPNARVPLFA